MLGTEILQLREKADIPQATLAAEVGMPRWKLCRIEKGSRRLKSEEAEALVAAIHTILGRRSWVGVGG